MNEKQIDELCRMIRDYVVSGNMDVRLADMMMDFGHASVWPSVDYFLQSLRREFIEPEVVNRDKHSIADFVSVDDDKKDEGLLSIILND